MNILFLGGIDILSQLHLEEYLLRHSEENWCLVNYGVREAIVMGISCQPEKWVDPEAPFPLIRRYSGGGTVIIDENTLLISFIGSHTLVTDGPLYPERLMRWSAEWFAPLFPEALFALRENDYTLGGRKCAGNAQYIKKRRFVHHISWLWSFDSNKMRWLRLPPQMPEYRQKRPHEAFLTTLAPYFETKELFSQAFVKELERQFLLTFPPKCQPPSTFTASSKLL